MSNLETLTSRHWIGEYPSGMTMRLKFTEVEPGQFVGQPYKPRTVHCWSSCPAPTEHMLHPCTAEQYEADDDEAVVHMNELDIPERAYEVGETAHENAGYKSASARFRSNSAVEAAAAIIVAARLRLLASHYERHADSVPLHPDGTGTERRRTFLDAADIARADAYGLDPDGAS